MSQCPEQNCKLENDSDSNSDDPVMLSYATICGTICTTITPVLGDTKIPFNIKKKLKQQVIIRRGENVPKFYTIPDLIAQTSAVSVFDQVPPATMVKAQ